VEPDFQIDLGDGQFARPPHSGNLFDGRLLAEYDIYGACLRDYIYMGSRLVAEYVPATQQYFYYTQDQIHSTQIVTNDTGAVVYAEAHDPYGGIQKTWVNEFDPKRKFSDKERDGETGLDYFGARYYSAPDNSEGQVGRYRWLSLDPVLDRRQAMANSQLWNLYTFCGNNPIRFTDPDGRVLYVDGMYSTIKAIAGDAADRLSVVDGMLDVSKITDEDMKDPGVRLLVALAESEYIFSYSEVSSVMTAGGMIEVSGTSNLDRNPDWRFEYKGGKSPTDLPSPGIDGQVVVNPNNTWWDLATKSKKVSLAAIAFHELAEAFFKVQFHIQYMGKDGSPGAHVFAGYWEQLLSSQRKDFSAYPGGGSLSRIKRD
jgi:RHS repeat-associated protein